MTKKPVCKFWIAITMVKAWLAGTVPKFAGNWNFEDGISVVAGICPMGAGLHDPVLICWPLVMGWFVVAQKLMKLLVEVIEGT